MSADPIPCSWKALKLNTANCAQGRGKMQVSFSHVGTGGARKTPPLSLGTWPTEGKGYEEALSWYLSLQHLRSHWPGASHGATKTKRGLRLWESGVCVCATLAPSGTPDGSPRNRKERHWSVCFVQKELTVICTE